MKYLEEKAEQGTATTGEKAELVRLQTADLEKNQRADAADERAARASRQRALGRLGFLEEMVGLGQKLTLDEELERQRLRSTMDSRDAKSAAAINKEQREALAAGMKAALGGTKESAEKFTLDILEGRWTQRQPARRSPTASRRTGRPTWKPSSGRARSWGTPPRRSKATSISECSTTRSKRRRERSTPRP